MLLGFRGELLIGVPENRGIEAIWTLTSVKLQYSYVDFEV